MRLAHLGIWILASHSTVSFRLLIVFNVYDQHNVIFGSSVVVWRLSQWFIHHSLIQQSIQHRRFIHVSSKRETYWHLPDFHCILFHTRYSIWAFVWRRLQTNAGANLSCGVTKAFKTDRIMLTSFSISLMIASGRGEIAFLCLCCTIHNPFLSTPFSTLQSNFDKYFNWQPCY